MAKKTAKKASKKRSKKVVGKAASKAPNKESKDSENKSAVTVETLEDRAPKQGKIKPGERLYLNAAKDTLVPEGHKDAATLYCTEHKEVNRAEFESLKKKKK